MLRVSNPCSGPGAEACSNTFFSLDKRKKQVNLIDPSTCGSSSAPEDRRVGVAAPKMFAFDAIFSQDDSQVIWDHSHSGVGSNERVLTAPAIQLTLASSLYSCYLLCLIIYPAVILT
ncbi:hypothetical protein Zmor_010511 [Zophobas morio]|uniref:Uncharacterized protein n=1 Tax=Zophobas morio TaxID=2755281 RepID=A0AA38MIW2_9CUCU|nr:hypothetical protein Zmor_010511 [Zophobas morio]